MASVDGWWSAARREPAAYACQLARARIWQDERRFVATVADVAEAAPFLEVDEALAHALVLVLSRLPRAARKPFADAFYARRTTSRRDEVPADAGSALAAAAAVALLVVELAEDDELAGERVRDLLQGAAQGDDLSRTPLPALSALAQIVAHARRRLERRDPSSPAASAVAAVVEVLAPASGVVALKEVVVRSAWAAVVSWEPARVLAFLLEVDRILESASR